MCIISGKLFGRIFYWFELKILWNRIGCTVTTVTYIDEDTQVSTLLLPTQKLFLDFFSPCGICIVGNYSSSWSCRGRWCTPRWRHPPHSPWGTSQPTSNWFLRGHCHKIMWCSDADPDPWIRIDLYLLKSGPLEPGHTAQGICAEIWHGNKFKLILLKRL